MQNLSDNDLDQLFRQVAEQNQPDFDPADWKAMSQRLDTNTFWLRLGKWFGGTATVAVLVGTGWVTLQNVSMERVDTDVTVLTTEESGTDSSAMTESGIMDTPGAGAQESVSAQSAGLHAAGNDVAGGTLGSEHQTKQDQITSVDGNGSAKAESQASENAVAKRNAIASAPGETKRSGKNSSETDQSSLQSVRKPANRGAASSKKDVTQNSEMQMRDGATSVNEASVRNGIVGEKLAEKDQREDKHQNNVDGNIDVEMRRNAFDGNAIEMGKEKTAIGAVVTEDNVRKNSVHQETKPHTDPLEVSSVIVSSKLSSNTPTVSANDLKENNPQDLEAAATREIRQKRMATSEKLKDEEADSVSGKKSDKPKNDKTEVKIEQKDSAAHTSFSKLAVRVKASPDFSSENFGPSGKTGFSYGVEIEYFASERLSISLGALRSTKYYKVHDAQYFNFIDLDIDGDCAMWDIPLNVNYYFSPARNYSFFISGGFSSYLMSEENYHFQVSTPGYMGPETNIYSQQVKGKNQEWFKVINVSIGVQRRISRRFAFQLEPFVKIPLAEVGSANIELSSFGTYLSLRYNFMVSKNE